MNTQKPRANEGTKCPLWRKDVSKVCHTCEFWEPLPVGRRLSEKNVETFDKWCCTLKHQTFVLRDIVFGLDGLQKSEESFRNSAWKESQQNLHDIVEAVKHQTGFNNEILRKLGDGLSEMARAIDTPRAAQIDNRPSNSSAKYLENKQ